MNILMLLKSKSSTTDIRILKEARSLIKAGHNVFVLSNNNNNEEKYLDIENIKFILIPATNEYLYRLLLVKLCIYYPFARRIKQLINEFSIDAIHVHDLPLLNTALKAAGNLPVIADLHENYPAAVKTYVSYFSFRNVLRILALDTYGTWRKYEKKYLKHANKIIVVVPEAKDRFSDYDLDMNKVHVVSNTEDINNIPNFEIDAELREKYKNNFVVSYVGGFGPHRGIDTSIMAISLLIDSIPNIKLLLVGSGRDYNKVLYKIINKLKLHEYVEFIGWQKLEKVYAYKSISDVCLVPHNQFEHTNTTVPHKLFQCMYLGKPVIVSSCKPLKRIVSETNSGLCFTANNSHEMAKQITKLHQDRELRQTLGKNGRQAVIDKYNWDTDANELLRLYDSLKT